MKMRGIIYAVFSLVIVFGISGCSNAKKNDSYDTEAPTEKRTEERTEGRTEEKESVDISTLNLEYGNLEEFKKIYNQIQSVDNAENFVATWNRTDVQSSMSAHIIVTNQDTEGFDFSGDFSYYSHSGCLAGRAYFVSSDIAIYEYQPEYSENDITQYVVFERTEEGLNVIASDYSGALGLGANVTVDGTYIEGEPMYTNATVLEDNFTADEQESIKNMLGNDYDEYFKDVVEYGVLERSQCTLEDGTNAAFYEGFIPTMGGYAFELLKCENGDLYFYSEAEEIGWKTNVSGAIDYPAYEVEE